MKTQIVLTALLTAVVMSSAAAQPNQGERPDFGTLDLNGDGGLTMEEFQAHGAARFDTTDTNGDGGLSREELIAAANARQTDRITRMMSRFDEDGDGLLQQAELPQSGGDRLARMFERADADGDGAITQAEFDAAQERWGRRHGGGDRG